MHSKKYQIGRWSTSDTEIKHLFRAWFFISLAFGIVMSKGNELSFTESFLIATLTVGIGFLLHEIGHKIIAQYYDAFAEFRAWNGMLFLAVIMSFFGFVIAAPGAVMIHGLIGRRRNGTISAAGPAINFMVAIAFILIFFMVSSELARIICYYGIFVNTWLGIFNLIPFANFDGKKILAWNKAVYVALVIIGLSLMALTSSVIA